MSPADPRAHAKTPNQRGAYLVASLMLVPGMALLLTGHWWALPVIGLLDGIPGGRWLSVPVPYLPLIAVALGVRLLATAMVRPGR